MEIALPIVQNLAFAELIIVSIGGAVGALIEDCTNDGYLELPHSEDGKFYVGFIGGMLLGMLAGCIVDGGFGTALIGGFMGKSIISRLLAK